MNTSLRYSLFLFLVLVLAANLQAQSIASSKTAILFQKATELHDADFTHEAIGYYTKTLALHPHHERALFNRGLLYFEHGFMEDARTDFSLLLKLQPSDQEAYLLRAQASQQLNDLQAALEDYNWVVQLSPYAQHFASRAQIQLELEDYPAALNDFNKAIELDGQDIAILAKRADLLYRLGYFTEAIEDYDAVVRLNPQDRVSITKRKQAFRQLKKDTAGKQLAYHHRSADHGHELMAGGQLQDALRAFASVAKTDHQYANAQYCMGLIKIRLKEYADAIFLLDLAIEADPTPGSYFYYRAVSHLKLNQYSAAIADFNEAETRKVDHTELYSHRGWAKFQAGDLENALTDLKTSVEKDANNMVAYERMNKCYYALAHRPYDELFASRSTITASITTDYRKYLNDRIFVLHAENRDLMAEALFLNKAGRYDEAIPLFNQLIHLEPANHKAYNGRGYAQYHLEQFEKALQDFSVAIDLDADYSEAYYNRGAVYYAQDSLDAAINDFDLCIQLEDDLPMAYFMRAQCYAHESAVISALDDYSKCLKLDPANVDALNNRGALKLVRGDSWGALEDFSQAISIRPDHELLYANRARAYAAMEDFGAAIQDYNTALSKDLDNEVFFFGRAMVWYKMQQYHRTVEDINWALQSSQLEPADYYYWRAMAYQKQEKWDKAITDLDRALELNPDYKEAYYNRGQIREFTGDTSGAYADLQKAAKLGFDTEMTALNKNQ